MTATDRAAGKLQGAADAVQGTAHEARSGDRNHELSSREARRTRTLGGRAASPEHIRAGRLWPKPRCR